ncbi:MAG: hypothetical protein ABSG04_14230 [Verrucomicrobiota bacterium]
MEPFVSVCCSLSAPIRLVPPSCLAKAGDGGSLGEGGWRRQGEGEVRVSLTPNLNLNLNLNLKPNPLNQP